MSIEQNDEQADVRWQAAPADSLAWACWGNDFIVYHRPSARTHFLNRSSQFLLNEFLQVPQPTSAVVDVFCSEGADQTAIRREIFALLEHLDELGLVRRAGPTR